MKKATNRKINRDFLHHRARTATLAGYPKQKWVEFCEAMLDAGFEITLYEARQTVSKYITVRQPYRWDVSFKVRFSNHKPIPHREAAGDCDFFVGHINKGVTTTADAIAATFRYFKAIEEKK